MKLIGESIKWFFRWPYGARVGGKVTINQSIKNPQNEVVEVEKEQQLRSIGKTAIESESQWIIGLFVLGQHEQQQTGPELVDSKWVEGEEETVSGILQFKCLLVGYLGCFVYLSIEEEFKWLFSSASSSPSLLSNRQFICL